MSHARLWRIFILVTSHLLVISHWACAKLAPPAPRFACPERPLLHYPCRCEAPGDIGISILCDNTNLAQLGVALLNVRTPIDRLVLRNMSFARLMGPALHVVAARSLVIEHTPLVGIEAHALRGINSTLLNLTLLDTRLSRVPTTALTGLGNLQVLRIEGNTIGRLEAHAFRGLSRLTDLVLRHGNISEMHAHTFDGLSRLRRLSLAYNHLQSLPASALKSSRRLNNIDLAHNRFSELHPTMLRDSGQLVWCNLSHNALTTLGRATFSRNGALGYLDVSHNAIESISAKDLRGARSLRRLFLNDNRIGSVGRGAFHGSSRLGTVDLARNQLDRVDRKMFADMSYLERVDLAENQIGRIDEGSFTRLYQTHVNISHNRLTQLDSDAFVSCQNMSMLDLSHNRLPEFNGAALDDASTMTELRLQFNSITNLSQLAVGRWRPIQILNVSHNALTSVPKGAFPSLYELHTLDLSHNLIAQLSTTSFGKLVGLRWLNLSHNLLSRLKASTLGTAPALTTLDLSHNRLNRTSSASFAGLLSLRRLLVEHNLLSSPPTIPQSLATLDVSFNRLTDLSGGRRWPTMNSLLSLNLDGNRLGDSLQPGTFEKLRSLQRLYARNCSLTHVPWSVLSELTSLRHLYLDDNAIQNLDRPMVTAPGVSVTDMPVLFELSLRRNGLRNVTNGALAHASRLIFLTLAENRLESLPGEALRGLIALQTLDLSHNQLTALHNRTNGLLEPCVSLRRLNLSHNSLTQLHRLTFPYSRWVPYRLRSLDVSYNRLTIVDAAWLRGLRHLQSLNASHNTIVQLQPQVLGNLTQLQQLDLSHNQLSRLEADRLGPNRQLHELRLAFNFIQRLPASTLQQMRSLRLLDVRGNRLRRFDDTALMPLLRNGSRVLYAGNELLCDCALRPLLYWLDEHPAAAALCGDLTHTVTCSTAATANNTRLPLTQLTADQLQCVGPEQRTAERYRLRSELQFRRVRRSPDGKSVTVEWFVTWRRRDVANFVVLVRAVNTSSSSSSASLTSSLSSKSSRSTEVVLKPLLLPYTRRKAMLAGLTPHATYLVCVRAFTSAGQLRDHTDGQCQVSAASPVSVVVLLLAYSVVSSLLGWRWFF